MHRCTGSGWEYAYANAVVAGLKALISLESAQLCTFHSKMHCHTAPYDVRLFESAAIQITGRVNTTDVDKQWRTTLYSVAR